MEDQRTEEAQTCSRNTEAVFGDKEKGLGGGSGGSGYGTAGDEARNV